MRNRRRERNVSAVAAAAHDARAVELDLIRFGYYVFTILDFALRTKIRTRRSFPASKITVYRDFGHTDTEEIGISRAALTAR